MTLNLHMTISKDYTNFLQMENPRARLLNKVIFTNVDRIKPTSSFNADKNFGMTYMV